MDLGQVNPLQKHVAAIAAAPEYIDNELLKTLLAAIPESARNGFLNSNGTASDGGNMLLREQLDKMAALNKQMMTEALASEDPADKKAAMASGRDMFNLLARYQETINAQERLVSIERAYMDTVREIDDPKIRDVFLKNLRKNLQKENNRAQNKG